MSESVKQQAGNHQLTYRWVFLITCLWAAFLVRVWGLDFGLPYEFHPDEYKYVDAAINWHLTGRMQLGFVNPPLFTYVLALAFWIWFVVAPFTHSFDWVAGAYAFARLWSVSFGLLTVALTYPLGKRIYNWKAGMLAVSLLAGLFLPAREAHFAVNDTALTFFVLLAIYFSIEVFRRRQWSTYIKAGIAVGLASAAKLTGGIVMTSLIVAHFLTVKEQSNPTYERVLTWKGHGRLWLSLFAALATFSVFSTYIILDLPRFFEEVSRHLQFGTEGYKGLRMTSSTGWGFYVDVLGWGMGWLMLAAIVIALGRIFFQRQRQEIVVAVFALALFAYMGGQRILFARFILPALPPLVVLVAVSLARFERIWPFWHRYQMVIWPIVIGALSVQSWLNLVWFDHLLTLPDTRQIATEWFTKEFPEDTVVAREGYSILPQILFLHSDWPYKRIDLDETGPTRNSNDHYVAHKTQVIALSNFIFERVRQDPTSEKARREQLAYLAEKADLIKTFDPYRRGYHHDWFYLDQLYGPAAETLQRVLPGPLIKLYRLPYENQPFSLDMPNISVRVDANFWGKLILLGYDLPLRRAEPGGAFPITLYWQAATRMQETYVVSNHLLDNQQRNWGGYDRWPRESANTILWRPGEVVIDTFSLPVAAAAPDGIYIIDIGLYNQADPGATPLPILRDGQPIDQNSVRIGPVKVGGPPPGVVLSPQEVAPQTQLEVKLGGPPKVLLRGYDAAWANDGLKLTLYWESLAQIETDWTTFVHLRDAAGKIVVQKDGPTGDGRYPTSLWDVGEIIADDVVVPIAGLSKGDYSLFVGLYDLETGIRLSVPDNPADEIRLARKIGF